MELIIKEGVFGDVIIGRSDDSLLGFEAGGFQVFPDFLFDLRREIFLEKGESCTQ